MATLVDSDCVNANFRVKLSTKSIRWMLEIGQPLQLSVFDVLTWSDCSALRCNHNHNDQPVMFSQFCGNGQHRKISDFPAPVPTSQILRRFSRRESYDSRRGNAQKTWCMAVINRLVSVLCVRVSRSFSLVPVRSTCCTYHLSVWGKEAALGVQVRKVTRFAREWSTSPNR